VHLGDLTITSVSEAITDAERQERIETWARSVWDAYSELQFVGREWLKRAMV
jgi:hypothetical protein